MAIRQQFLVFQKQMKINSSNLDKFSIKIASKNTSKQRRFFCPSKLGQTKRYQNDINFLLIEITSNKVRPKDVTFSLFEITTNKLCQNDVVFSTIKITSDEVCRNDANFSPIEITSKKVHRKDV